MKNATSREARKLFPVKRVCPSPGCKKAVIVCMNCLRRGCRHYYKDRGYLNLETLADHGQGATITQLLRGHLLPLGFCQTCPPITREESFAKLRKHLA
jgi:hypothetical protein